MKELTLKGTTINGGLHYAEGTLERRNEFLKSFKDGTPIEVTLRRHYQKKTNAQTRTFFGHFAQRVADELNDRGETVTIQGRQVPYSKQIVKEVVYAAGLLPTDEDGEQITISRQDSKQMSEFYNKCVAFVAQPPWCVFVRDPEPQF